MLIKTTEELKGYIGTIHKNMNINTLLSFIEQVEYKYILPFVGMAQLEELQVAYDGAALTDAQKVLMKLLGRSIAYYALLDAMPYINASLGDAGITEYQGQGAAPVRQWAYFQYQDSSATNADVFLDMALEHLDKNAATFPAWAQSEAYTESKALFINTTGELSKFLNVQGSRRAFIALQPFQLRAEELYVAPVLGTALHQELKAALLAPAEQTPQQKELLRLVKRALAQYTVLESIPELAFTHTGSGLKVLNENDGIRQRLSISADERNKLSILAQSRADIYMSELKNLLDKILQEGETEPTDRQQAYQLIDNTGSVSFWV